jgi:lipopolysaccharide export system permease protein
LTGQVVATLLMTVSVFTFVLLLANSLKDILVLLMNRQASFGMVAEAFALLMPWVLAFALPMGMLTAALLVFGRFSADQELTAVRSSGVSLVALIGPILLLSILLCGVCACINMEVAPRCRVAYVNLRYRMGAQIIGASLPEQRFVDDIPGYIFYIGRNEGHFLRDVHVYELEAGRIKSASEAPVGWLMTTNNQTWLHLAGGVTVMDGEGDSVHYLSLVTADTNPLEFKTGNLMTEKPKVSDMTFTQLQAELGKLESLYNQPTTANADPEQLQHQLLEMQREQREQRDMTMPVLIQMHRQLAFSFACFSFTLVGIPLGIRAHRRETNAGFVLALILVLIYYSFIVLAQSLGAHPGAAPHLIMWIPNIIFEAAGVVLLWRANRGF